MSAYAGRERDAISWLTTPENPIAIRATAGGR